MSIPSLTLTGVANIVANSTSQSVELSTTGTPTTALIANLSGSVVYVLLGAAGVEASAGTGVAVLPGSSIALAIGENTYLAALGTGTAPSGLNIALGS